MSVYYRIRNAKGEYWDGNRFCAFVAYADSWRVDATADLERIQKNHPTARIVKVTVKRKAKP